MPDPEQNVTSNKRPTVPPSSLHKIQDLRQISNDILDKLKELEGFERYAYLFELTDSSIHHELDSFIKNVVDNSRGSTTHVWSRSVLLVPELPITELLRQPLDRILSSMGQQSSSWRQVDADFAQWESGFEYSGSPGVLIEDPDSDLFHSDDVTAIRANALTSWPVRDIRLAALRWMASKIAFAARTQGIDFSASPKTLIETAGVSISEASPDALIAARGLAAESHLSATGALPPGFRAADTEYLK